MWVLLILIWLSFQGWVCLWAARAAGIIQQSALSNPRVRQASAAMGLGTSSYANQLPRCSLALSSGRTGLQAHAE